MLGEWWDKDVVQRRGSEMWFGWGSDNESVKNK